MGFRKKQTGGYYSSHNSKYQLIEIRFEAAKKTHTHKLKIEDPALI